MTEELVVVKVGMADLNVVQGKGVIRTAGLGSCVGLTLFDPVEHIVGMAHIMLPNSETSRIDQINLMKYADTAIPMLLEQVLQLGASRRRLQAKMAGGSQMFAFKSMTDTMRIGPRNVENSKEMLQKLAIPLIAEDTGGNYGRTVEMNSLTGILHIRSVQMGVKEI